MFIRENINKSVNCTRTNTRIFFFLEERWETVGWIRKYDIYNVWVSWEGSGMCLKTSVRFCATIQSGFEGKK